MKPPRKGFFKGVLGSRLGLSLFRSDSVLASWPALSAQSPEILFRLGAVLSPAGDLCVAWDLTYPIKGNYERVNGTLWRKI